MIQQTIKPIPYYSTHVTTREKALAADLREEFKSKIARSLPNHHIVGFKANHILKVVADKKTRYPFFLKVDIAKFYPNIRPRDLVVYAQLAYRDLLYLDYVPRSFKKRYLKSIVSWCNDLPISRGIPIGSPVSAILAPVMLVPLWLDAKRRFRSPFIVFMDDVLFCVDSQEKCAELYAWLQNELTARYDLSLNITKTQSGRFSSGSVDFCGWRFAGGYTGICPDRVENFKQAITKEINRTGHKNLHSFLKRINRKIDGFGNYYKHGNVRKEFENLDIFVRTAVRSWLKSSSDPRQYTNEQLHDLGLHSLETCYRKLHDKQIPKKTILRQPTPSLSSRTPATPSGYEQTLLNHQIDLFESINKKLTELLSLQREQANYLRIIALKFREI